MRITPDSNRVAGAFIMMSIVGAGVRRRLGGAHRRRALAVHPGTVLPSIVSLLFFGPHAVVALDRVGNGLLIVAMVSLPGSIVGPPLPSGALHDRRS